MAQGKKTGGRRKGTPNRTTQTLKDAILLAADEVGSDGNGADGLKGYLKRVAVEDVKAFAGLLGRVLPLQVAGADGEDGEPTAIEMRIVYPRASAPAVADPSEAT